MALVGQAAEAGGTLLGAWMNKDKGNSTDSTNSGGWGNSNTPVMS